MNFKFFSDFTFSLVCATIRMYSVSFVRKYTLTLIEVCNAGHVCSLYSKYMYLIYII